MSFNASDNKKNSSTQGQQTPYGMNASFFKVPSAAQHKPSPVVSGDTEPGAPSAEELQRFQAYLNDKAFPPCGISSSGKAQKLKWPTNADRYADIFFDKHGYLPDHAPPILAFSDKYRIPNQTLHHVVDDKTPTSAQGNEHQEQDHVMGDDTSN